MRGSAPSLGAALGAVALPSEPPDGITIQRVTDRRGLAAWLSVVDACGFFDTPEGEGRAAGYDLANLAPTPAVAALYLPLGFEISATPLRRWFYLPV